VPWSRIDAAMAELDALAHGLSILASSRHGRRITSHPEENG
jgi:hypothetical protein